VKRCDLLLAAAPSDRVLLYYRLSGNSQRLYSHDLQSLLSALLLSHICPQTKNPPTLPLIANLGG
jgi:hypothetical protein